MLYGTTQQFQLYDKLLIEKKNWKIQQMVLEAAKALYRHIPTTKQILICSGKGNNGADGLALAYLLKKNVSVYLFCQEEQLSLSGKYYLEKIKEHCIPLITSKDEFLCALEKSDVVVDGIFGTGFKGSLPIDLMSIIQTINNSNKEVISIDIPSGLDANLGTIENGAIEATKTITFMTSKVGFLNPESWIYTGEIIVEDILHDDDLHQEVLFSELLEEKRICQLLKSRLYNGYKGSYGLVECRVGSKKYPGAAMLSVGAALHTGCGFVRFINEDFIQSYLINKYPEVIYTDSSKTADAILFGCGKGWNSQTKDELIQLISNQAQPILIDADGLNCLSEHINLLESKKGPIILTPHVGEMERLMPGNPTLAAIELARKYQAIVVLKGPKTMVCDGKRCVRIPSGNKAMAVAGMGDCLAGMIASLLAQHYHPFDACVLGCYLHGKCGDELAKTNYTVLTSKLIEIIPKVMNKIENDKD